MDPVNDVGAEELGHWDHDSDGSFPSLLGEITTAISDHFADFYFHAEEGKAAAVARKRWVASLARVADALSDVGWDESWVDGWSEVLRSAADSHARELDAWHARVARALADRGELVRLAQTEEIRPDFLERLLSSYDSTINSEPPGEPVLENGHAAAKRVARRGLVAQQLVGQLEEARMRASRSLDLLDLLRRTQHSQNVRLYLRRCGRAYILGAYPEACVLCAAAIELRLSEVIESDDAVKRLKLRGEWELTLGRKLKYAGQVGLIPRSQQSDLRWLVELRNTVMHFTVGLDDSRESALRALRLLVDLLGRLEKLQ